MYFAGVHFGAYFNPIMSNVSYLLHEFFSSPGEQCDIFSKKKLMYTVKYNQCTDNLSGKNNL